MIDKDIKLVDRAICDNISKKDVIGVGLLSQNVLAQLRNLVEFVAIKIYGEHVGEHLENNQGNNKEAIEFIKSRGNLKFLSRFHHFLQVSRSHYITDYDNAERLMLKYLDYLLKLRLLCSEVLDIQILQNLEDFPVYTEDSFVEYYEQISNGVECIKKYKHIKTKNDRFYVQKIKPFYINDKIYYEVTLTKASDYASKFDRIIAFTDMDIMSNYSIIAYLVDWDIEVFGIRNKIKIITKWSVSIRVCEINNFLKIIGRGVKIQSNYSEYRELNKYLTHSGMNLLEIVDLDDKYYNYVKSNIHTEKNKVKYIFNALDICRNIFKERYSGSNVLRYLLLRLNNKVIKRQYNAQSCDFLSNLNLKWGCNTFERMPFVSSLMQHNPRLYDVFSAIDPSDREHELLARVIKNNTESKSRLYTSLDELPNFKDIDTLIDEYNSRLYWKHRPHRDLKLEKGHLFINGYEEDTIFIIKAINELSKLGVKGYKNTVRSWINESNRNFDDEDKLNMLTNMFEESRVSLIYGSAGTGKTYLIEHLSHLFNDYDKLFLANTHPAVNNLKRRVNNNRSEFMTIAKYLFEGSKVNCDILVIDECSTVNNADLRRILEQTEFRILILVGDIYQIESITFGNWFNISKNIVNKSAIHELSNSFRTNDDNLLNLWNNVRKLSDKIPELLAKGNYSSVLNESIFTPQSEDEIILCLNYDGLYGINNINKFLQSSNPNPLIEWGVNGYKVGDPILFNETKRFSPILYNNLKGRIVRIDHNEKEIWFDIEVETTINELQIEDIDLELISISDTKSIVRLSVSAFKNSDEDEDGLLNNYIVPFQIAYSVSIHKAQGLEYDSVKVIITKEIEELISHNIFYTAITRAKNYLKIYWSTQSQKRILDYMELIDNNKDYHLIKTKI